MSKSITIPEIGMTPIRLRINCTDYVFHAGETQTVPDEVAALLAGIVASIPQPAADGYRTKPATIGDVEDMIAAGGGGGGGSALICEGSYDAESGVYTLETPLADIVTAYQAGRDVLLPMPVLETGAVCYLHPQAAVDLNGVRFVTFQGYFDNEGTLELTTVAFIGTQTATAAVRRYYAGPFDIPCEIDMTQQPPTSSTDFSYDDVLAAYLSGRELRIKGAVNVGVEDFEVMTYLPMTMCETDNGNRQFHFGGIFPTVGGALAFMDVEFTKDGTTLTVTPLTT